MIATPSFTDEVLKQILVERGALSLTVLHLTSGDVESDRVASTLL